MASRSTKGGRPGSPVKKSSTTVNGNRNNDASVSGLYQNEDFSQADVVRGLTEREVEIDASLHRRNQIRIENRSPVEIQLLADGLAA